MASSIVPIQHPRIQNPHAKGRKQCFVTPSYTYDSLMEPTKMRTFRIVVEDKVFYIDEKEMAHESEYFRTICEKSGSTFYTGKNRELVIEGESWQDVQTFFQCVSRCLNNLETRKIDGRSVVTVLRLADRFMFVDTCKKCFRFFFEIEQIFILSLGEVINHIYAMLDYEYNTFKKANILVKDQVIRFLKAIRELRSFEINRRFLCSSTEIRVQKIDELMNNWDYYCHSRHNYRCIHCFTRLTSRYSSLVNTGLCYARLRPFLLG